MAERSKYSCTRCAKTFHVKLDVTVSPNFSAVHIPIIRGGEMGCRYIFETVCQSISSKSGVYFYSDTQYQILPTMLSFSSSQLLGTLFADRLRVSLPLHPAGVYNSHISSKITSRTCPMFSSRVFPTCAHPV